MCGGGGVFCGSLGIYLDGDDQDRYKYCTCRCHPASEFARHKTKWMFL